MGLGESAIHRNVMLSLFLASSPAPSPWIQPLPIGRHHPIRTEEQTHLCGCLWNCSARGYKGEMTEASHGDKSQFRVSSHTPPGLSPHRNCLTPLWMLFPSPVFCKTELSSPFFMCSRGSLCHQHSVYLIAKITLNEYLKMLSGAA